MLTGCASSGGFDWSKLSVGTTPAPSAEAAPETIGELRLAMPLDSGAFDPLKNGREGMGDLFSLVFEGLLRVDGQGRVEPWLAETMERTEDGWRFTLRAQVQFHDGTVLSAQDVVNAFEALKASGEDGAYAYCLSAVTNLTAEDNRVLLAETTGGYDSLYGLCFPVARYPEGDGLAMGTGPYRVESYLAGVEMRLVRNENWWRRADGPQSLYVSAVEEASAEMVQGGELDAALVHLSTFSTLYAHSGIGLQDYLTGRVELLIPNLNGAFADLRLRQAAACLLDRRDIITNTYQGHGVSVEVPVWPDSFLTEQVGTQARDLERAAALLESLGWTDLDDDGLLERRGGFLPSPSPQPSPEETPAPSPSPTPTPSPTPRRDDEEDDEVTVEDLLGGEAEPEEDAERLRFSLLICKEDGASGMDAALCLQSQFREAGILLEIETLPFADWTARLQSGEFDLALGGYRVGASADLTPLLGSEGANNVMGYQSAAMDAALNALRTVRTEEEYQVAAQRVYEYVQEELPLFPLLMRTGTRVTAAGIHAASPSRQGDAYRGLENWEMLGS